MRKMLALFLAAVMCLALAACGGTETPNANGNEKEQYTAVEITMDNWSQYLEFTSKYSAYYKESAFSDVPKEVTTLCQDFYFGVKDEYFSRLDTVKSTITVRISTEFGTQHGTFADDYSSFDPNGEFEGSTVTMESIDGDFRVTDHEKFAWHITSAAATHKTEWEAGELYKWLKNQQVLNITGTLYIAE